MPVQQRRRFKESQKVFSGVMYNVEGNPGVKLCLHESCRHIWHLLYYPFCRSLPIPHPLTPKMLQIL
jgi:hypothetical protein